MSIRDILEHLGDLNFPLPQERAGIEDLVGDLQRLQRDMKIPSGFNPTDENPNAATASFFEKWKVGAMWRRDPFVKHATDAMMDPHVRRSLEVMLLGPLSVAAIANRLADRWSLSPDVMNARTIREFSHYYWLYTSMNISQWKSFFFTHYPKGDYSDLLMALNAPRTGAGAALTLAVSDRGADALSSSEAYNAFRNTAFVMYMQHATMERPSLARTQGAFFALQTFRMAEEELDKTRGASAELLEELRKMVTVYDRGRVLTIREVPVLRPMLPTGAMEEKEPST
jgi:hypothetical protein